MAVHESIDLTDVELFDRFVHGRLSKSQWTHEAHLVACWVALQTRTPTETVDFPRDAIKSHNCGVGTANTDTSGYHETLTVYFTAAVANAGAKAPADLNAAPHCSSAAALQFWSRDELFSTAARQRWKGPDLSPLPIGVRALVDQIVGD